MSGDGYDDPLVIRAAEPESAVHLAVRPDSELGKRRAVEAEIDGLRAEVAGLTHLLDHATDEAAEVDRLLDVLDEIARHDCCSEVTEVIRSALASPPTLTTTDNDPVYVSVSSERPRCAIHDVPLVTQIDMGRVHAGVGGPRPTLVCGVCLAESFLPTTTKTRSHDEGVQGVRETARMFRTVLIDGNLVCDEPCNPQCLDCPVGGCEGTITAALRARNELLEAVADRARRAVERNIPMDWTAARVSALERDLAKLDES